MLELMGYDTGVDQDAIHAIAAALPELVGHDLPSHILKAGPRLTLHPAPPSRQ